MSGERKNPFAFPSSFWGGWCVLASIGLAGMASSAGLIAVELRDTSFNVFTVGLAFIAGMMMLVALDAFDKERKIDRDRQVPKP